MRSRKNTDDQGNRGISVPEFCVFVMCCIVVYAFVTYPLSTVGGVILYAGYRDYCSGGNSDE